MNDMEKCFYEPAELSVVDEGKGKSLVREKGSPYKLGFLVAQAADGIFKSLGDADAVDAMERVIVSTIYYMGETLIPLATEDKKMAGLICWSQLAPVEDEIKNNGFIRFYQRKLGNGRTYFVVKNGMRVRAAVTSYSLNEYAEATLQELVAMLAETHTGEQEEHEQTFDNLTDEAEDEADDEKA